MKGFHNHDVLFEGTFLKATVTKDKYRMISMNQFPALIKTQKDYQIYGEVYEVDELTLDDLDHLEGNGHFYKREKVRVQGISQPVWVYFLIEKDYYKSSDKGIQTKNGIQRWIRR
jgi:gamma-glutamylcyclotransferase (GGCT)/AIG2-like uncharacterized protein YtfP